MKIYLFLSVALLFAHVTLAQEIELQDLRFSADINASIPFIDGGNVSGIDDTIFVLDPATNSGNAFGFIEINMDRNDVNAYHDTLYSFSNIGTFGGTVVYPNDVFNFFSGTKIIDGRNDGIPSNVNIDAVSIDPTSGDPVISIDIPAIINGQLFRPDDLIRFDGTSFSLFDALNTGLDLDGIHILSDEKILISFESSGFLPNGAGMIDDDIFRWNPATDTYSAELFTAEVDPSWFAADLDALYAIERPPVGEFEWASTVFEVLETDGSVTTIIRRNNGSAGEVTLTFSISDVNATPGSDYIVPATNMVTFADGEVFNVVTLVINDDALIEGNESFFIDLVATSDGTLSTPTRTRILIRDDEDFVFADSFETTGIPL